MTESDIEWVAPGRAALVLRVSTKTIERLADSGRLRSIRTDGGHRRVALADVHTLITERSQDGAA